MVWDTHIHCRVLSIEEKLKDTSISYENKLLVEEKKHRDAVVRLCVHHTPYVLVVLLSFVV